MLPSEYFTMPYSLAVKEGEVPQNANLFLSVPLASIIALAFGLMIVVGTEPTAEPPLEQTHLATNGELR